MVSKNFHHYCVAREVSIITDHKVLVAIFKYDVATLSENTMNSTQNTQIQSQHHMQAWTRFVLRLAFQTKPQGKQKCRNTWYVVKY